MDYTLPRLWERVKASASYQQRSAEVAAFNRGSPWVKRGLGLTHTRCGADPHTERVPHSSPGGDAPAGQGCVLFLAYLAAPAHAPLCMPPACPARQLGPLAGSAAAGLAGDGHGAPSPGPRHSPRFHPTNNTTTNLPRRFDVQVQSKGAYVSIFPDGSVAAFAGGAELGQGLNTKVKQVRHGGAAAVG